MGACDSSNDNNQKSGIFSYNKSSMMPNSKNTTLTKYCYEKGEYILPQSICKRDEISKYYMLDSKVLGSGASGEVFIGIKNGKKYAVKKISKSKIKYAEDVIFEAQISASLNHKNIIKYYELFEDLKYISYVMELGEGGDLFDFITGYPTGHLPNDLAIDLLIQIFEVIDYLHNTARVIHRDLKPENFMITIDAYNRPIVKLIDFGLATYIPQHGEKLKEYVGTPEYCAPEILMKAGYREKVDEWAIGVIMFNMLTGLEPFNANNRNELRSKVCNAPIQFDYIQDPDFKHLNSLLMERDPNKRISARDALSIAIKLKSKFSGGLRSQSPLSRY